MGPRRRSLARDTSGLSTTEYIILLMIVACMGVAAWKLFGASAMSRAATASGDVSGLDQGVGGASRGGHGGPSTRVRSQLDEATADATPTPPAEDFTMPYVLLGGALVLLVVMMALRSKKGGGDGGGEGGEESA